jgi:uncharacterized protein DUF885
MLLRLASLLAFAVVVALPLAWSLQNANSAGKAATAKGAVVSPSRRSASSEEFGRFVDDYLDAFARRHPSIAAGNGIHQHDDLLEDYTQRAVREEIADLERKRARLRAIDASGLTTDEQVDRRILAGLIDAWLLDLATVQSWRKNPMIYASAISDGVHNLIAMESDPAEVRMRRVTSKLRRVPRLLAAARANITDPPRVFLARGIGMMRGAAEMLATDLPQAFASVKDERLQREMLAAARDARHAIEDYARDLEAQVPNAHGDFAIGAASLAARYRAEELIDLPLDTLLAIGMRELARSQAEFRAAAARVDPGRDPQQVWRDVLRNHPRRGELVTAAQRTVDDLTAFVVRRRLVTLPSDERVVVAAAPAFDLGIASMHSSPPLEATPVKSYYYVTDASAEEPTDEQDAWLQKFNYPTLAIISAHEVMPGHYVHSLFMRRTPGKLRRIWIGLNPFPQPSSGQDGWAHYAEQLVVDEGFHADDQRYRMAQLSEGLTRICRLLAGIRLHRGEWTVDQAAEFFARNAYLPARAARQEAERGTYDPTYGGYFLGKRAVLKLRRDYQAAMGSRFDLRAFHERVMTNGIAPWWAHRVLMLGDSVGVVVD